MSDSITEASPSAKPLDEIKRDYADQIFSKLFKKSIWEILVKSWIRHRKMLLIPGMFRDWGFSRPGQDFIRKPVPELMSWDL